MRFQTNYQADSRDGIVKLDHQTALPGMIRRDGTPQGPVINRI